jgi:hypothetical protein
MTASHSLSVDRRGKRETDRERRYVQMCANDNVAMYVRRLAGLVYVHTYVVRLTTAHAVDHSAFRPPSAALDRSPRQRTDRG